MDKKDLLILRITRTAGLLVFLFFAIPLLFLPTDSQRIRNLPLLCTAVAVFILVFIWRCLKRTLTLSRIKKLLAAKKVKDLHCNYIKFPFTAKSDISFNNAGEHFEIALISHVRPFVQYHFGSDRDIYFYISTRSSHKIGKSIALGGTSKKLCGGKALPWKQTDSDTRYAVIFDKTPSWISDKSSRDHSLGNRDLANGKIQLFEKEAFRTFVSEWK